MNNSVSTDLNALDEMDWHSKSGFDNDGSMELMLADGDSDERSVTKMIPDEHGSNLVPFVKQWSYSMHRVHGVPPLAKEASRLTLKAKAARAKVRDNLQLRGYRSLDCRRKCGLASLFVAFFFCVAGTAIMWCTTLFQDLVTGTMVISNSSNTWDWWRAPPVNPLLKVYIFNYTNADSFGRDGQKLRVKEVGPFTYRETTEKVDFKFYSNSTLSFHEKKSYEFLPEMSAYPEDAKLFVPNIPFMSAIATVRDGSFMERFGMNTLLRTLDAKPILHINARDLLFGYEDRLFSLARFAAINGNIPFKKFGLMVPKVGVSDHTIMMHTGEDDMERLGQITNVNGADDLGGMWNSEECNQLQGSDGSQFPPPHVSPNARLYVYNRDVCRRLPLVFKDYTEAQGMPAYRFHMPRNVFDNPRDNPDNQCFCHHNDTGLCLPSGVFNASACNFGAPLVMSFPHFLLGEPSLFHNVEGLRPDPEKHDMYVDVHPTLGLTLGGVSRLQINVQVRHAPGVVGQTMSHFKDLSILPVAWFELLVTEFPPPLKNLLYHATFTVRVLELLLSYGFLAGGIASAAVLLRRLCLKERGTLDLSTDSPDSDSA